MFARLWGGVGASADGNPFGLAVIQREVHQHQVAQPIFTRALAGEAAVRQRQGGITYPQQTTARALSDLDAAGLDAL
ncbi:hypothetical protein D3C78_1780620 [compost metagenome]